MDLETLVRTLEAQPQELPVMIDGRSAHGLESWRGNYDEITIDSGYGGGALTVAQLLDQAREAMNGGVFQGYKGGEYTMSPRTPVWGDPYGEWRGSEVVGVRIDTDALVVITVDRMLSAL